MSYIYDFAIYMRFCRGLKIISKGIVVCDLILLIVSSTSIPSFKKGIMTVISLQKSIFNPLSKMTFLFQHKTFLPSLYFHFFKIKHDGLSQRLEEW